MDSHKVSGSEGGVGGAFNFLTGKINIGTYMYNLNFLVNSMIPADFIAIKNVVQ
jgi:hypothetical protein